jgi:hypothetical protein
LTPSPEPRKAFALVDFVKDVRDNYAKTTREMKSIFRKLSAIPTENKMTP